MKNLALLCVIFIFCQCASNKPVPRTDFYVEVHSIQKIDSGKLEEAGKTAYSVKIDLINHTDSIVHFWVMSCSWQDSWISNHSGFCLSLVRCDSNLPDLQSLEPGSKISYNETIWIADSSLLQERIELKLGFVWIKKDESDVNDFDTVLGNKINQQKDIIWSNPIELPQ